MDTLRLAYAVSCAVLLISIGLAQVWSWVWLIILAFVFAVAEEVWCLKRGQEIRWIPKYLTIGIGVRRSSDGEWQIDGKVLPWFWLRKKHGYTKNGRKTLGLYFIVGERSYVFAWIEPEVEVM
jgi:uncharacterized oligopeptide transporter (OPT) family protein